MPPDLLVAASTGTVEALLLFSNWPGRTARPCAPAWSAACVRLNAASNPATISLTSPRRELRAMRHDVVVAAALNTSAADIRASRQVRGMRNI